MINRESLFTDETENFKTPYAPKIGDEVTLTFRTLANDVSSVSAVINGKPHSMKKAPKSDEEFDYYIYRFKCRAKSVSYYFEINDGDDKVFYNRLGAVNNNQQDYNFSFVAGQTVPEWAKGRVFYQIYCDRFCNGNKNNDVEDNEYYYTGGHSVRVRDWNALPAPMDVNRFYGGDLQGVEQKLDYLADLGVEAIYFNPLFVSPSNHKYDTQDYDYIDPHLAIIEEDDERTMQSWERHNGYAPKYIKRVTDKVNLEKSNEYFKGLVKKMHAKGIKVVIDGVFNHCGSFHKWMDREGVYVAQPNYQMGAFQSVTSPYRSYFKFFQPNVANSEYEGWWNYKTLPKLNYEKSADLCESVYKIGERWVSEEFDVDGWRLDVAADLGHSERFNHKFWKEFSSRVKSANPQAFIFAEHYGDPKAWLNGGEWDSVMNYDAFMEPVTWFLTGMEKHSQRFDGSKYLDGKAFFASMTRNMARLPRHALDSAINQLSNHDHSRFLTRTNRRSGTLKECGAQAACEGTNENIFFLGVLIQMTWPGSPALYYGDEVGQVGWTDPDSRRTFPWGMEEWGIHAVYKAAIALRKKINCLKVGSLIPLDAGDGYIAYGRFDKTDCAVVIINASEKPVSLSVPVWLVTGKRADSLTRAFAVGLGKDGVQERLTVEYGRAYIQLPPQTGCVYHKSFNK